MSKTKKTLMLVMSALLLVALSIGGTIAYLSDTKTVNNTFVVGKVNITLDEADVYEFGDDNIPAGKEHGQAIEGADRVVDNEYKIFPGHSYDKDPMVTVLAKSEACYVRTLVTVTYKEGVDADSMATTMLTWVEGLDSATWIPETDITTSKSSGYVTRTYELRYKDIVAASSSDQALKPIFTGIEIPGTLTNDQIALLEGFKIDVVAQAIQADGFDTADDAWGAF